jgi:hypothetical protein
MRRIKRGGGMAANQPGGRQVGDHKPTVWPIDCARP